MPRNVSSAVHGMLSKQLVGIVAVMVPVIEALAVKVRSALNVNVPDCWFVVASMRSPGHGPPMMVINSDAAASGFAHPPVIVQLPAGSPPQGCAPQVAGPAPPPQPSAASASKGRATQTSRPVIGAALPAHARLS